MVELYKDSATIKENKACKQGTLMDVTFDDSPFELGESSASAFGFFEALSTLMASFGLGTGL